MDHWTEREDGACGVQVLIQHVHAVALPTRRFR